VTKRRRVRNSFIDDEAGEEEEEEDEEEEEEEEEDEAGGDIPQGTSATLPRVGLQTEYFRGSRSIFWESSRHPKSRGFPCRGRSSRRKVSPSEHSQIHRGWLRG
jgi:hypothetical protein